MTDAQLNEMVEGLNYVALSTYAIPLDGDQEYGGLSHLTVDAHGIRDAKAACKRFCGAADQDALAQLIKEDGAIALGEELGYAINSMSLCFGAYMQQGFEGAPELYTATLRQIDDETATWEGLKPCR